MSFAGFGPDTLSFLQELSRSNTREWFAANADRYEQAVRGPAEAFIVELGQSLKAAYPTLRYDTRRNGAGSLMRIYRDVRFSPDKRPLKENVGIIFPLGEGKKVERPIFYLHIEAGNAFFYGGRHVFAPEVLAAYREAVDDGRRGAALESILADLARGGLRPMEEAAYKRVPRPYAGEHPRAALLRQAALGVGRNLGPGDLADPGLVGRCRDDALEMGPLLAWLSALDG